MIGIKVIHQQTGESQEKQFTPETLSHGQGLIGRNPKCDLVLNSPEVSRVHGRLLYDAGHYYYTDLGSTDGSRVNAQEVDANQNFLLKPNDIIQIGEFILLVTEIDLSSLVVTKVNLNSFAKQPSDRTTKEALKNDPVVAPTVAQVRPLILKAEQLEAQGIIKQSDSEFVYQSRRLVEGLSLAKHLRQRAIALYYSELDAGKFCVLVEYSNHFTLLQEK